MTRHRSLLFLLVTLVTFVTVGGPAGAQHALAATASTSATVDTTGDDDAGEGRPGFQYGVASGALSYPGGRTEQALGVVLRWVPVPWISLGVTPTVARIHEPAIASTGVVTRSGLVDLPLEASLSHAFKSRFTPTLSAGVGMTLPVGDTATGFGSGRTGFSATIGAGLVPVENVWLHASAGRSITDFSTQSTFGSGSGWADVGGGTSLGERLSIGAGYSTDFGDVDPLIGRSTSVSGNVAVTLRGATTFNVSTSRGLSGAAPDWSIAVGVGTAFPYLNHLGAGSALDNLRNTFGGGTHGLPTGTGTGTGKCRGRGRC